MTVRKGPMLAAAACAAVASLAGCSGQGPLACPSNQRYANSSTVGPWRIPDDLSAPKETDALQIPVVPGQSQPSAATDASGAPCLELPPTFHEQDDQTAPESRAAPRRGPAEKPRRASGRRRHPDRS